MALALFFHVLYINAVMVMVMVMVMLMVW